MTAPSRPRPPATRSAAAPAGVLTAVCAALVALLYVAAVRTPTGQAWDERLRGGLVDDAGRAGSAGGELLNTISVGSLAVVGGALMLTALVRRRPRVAVAAGLAVLGANVTTQWLKAHLERPDLGAEWWTSAGSYPSGHATVAMSLAVAAVLVAPTAARVSAAVLGGTYAVAVGVAVVGLDWHRPSDVLGGYLTAAAWGGLVITALALWPDAASARARVSRRGRIWGLLGATVATAVVGTLVVRAAGDVDLGRLWQDRTGLMAVGAVCAALSAALMTATVVLAERTSVGRPQAAHRRR